MSASKSSPVKTQAEDSPKPLTSAIVSSAIAATQSEYVFELPNAKILSIGTAFQSFSKLRSVDLSFNSLVTLSGIESLPDLRELKANGNKLTAITHLERAKQIEKLVLHDNVITTISGLKDAKFLKHLRLDGNRLRSIDGLDKCFSLSELDVSRNGITSAGTKGLRPLTKLTALNLSYNQLTALGPDIASLSSLTELDLSHNSLGTPPPTPTPTTAPTAGPLAGLHTMVALRILDVSSNSLSSLEHVAGAAGAQGLVVATPPPASAVAAAAASVAPDAAASIPAPATPYPGSPILELYLQRNKFAGSIPASFGATFKRAEILDLSGNDLGSQGASSASSGEGARAALAGLQGCTALSELDVSGNPSLPAAFDTTFLPSLAVLNGVDVGLVAETEGQTSLDETAQEVAQRAVSLSARPGTSNGRPGSARGPPPLLTRAGATRPGTASRPPTAGGTLSSSGTYSPDKAVPARPMSAAARSLGLAVGAGPLMGGMGAGQGQGEVSLDPAAQLQALVEAKESARANLATVRAAMREKISAAMQAMIGVSSSSVAQETSSDSTSTGALAAGGRSTAKGANRYLASRKPALLSAGEESSLSAPAFSPPSGISSPSAPAAAADVGESGRSRVAQLGTREEREPPAQRQPTRRSAAAVVTPATVVAAPSHASHGQEDSQDGQDIGSTGTRTAHSSPGRQGDEENQVEGQVEDRDQPILRKGAAGSMGLFAVTGFHTTGTTGGPCTPQDTTGPAGISTTARRGAGGAGKASTSNSRMGVGPVKASHDAAPGAVPGGIKINLGALREVVPGRTAEGPPRPEGARQAKSATEAAKASASQRPSSAGRRTGEFLAPDAPAAARASGGSSSSSSAVAAKASFSGSSAAGTRLSEQQLSTVLSRIK